MFNWEFLEVVAGLIFIYLLLSLLGGIITEIISSFISLRGHFLAKGIIRFLDDDELNLSDDFFANPNFKINHLEPSHKKKWSISRWFKKIWPFSRWIDDKKYPSYLSTKVFSDTVIDVLLRKTDNNESNTGFGRFEKIKTAIEQKLPDSETKQMLRSFINEAEHAKDKLAKFTETLDNRYDALMERVEGWFKRWVHIILFIVGIGIAVLFNADTFKIVKKLSENPQQRKQLIELAKTYENKIGNEKLQSYYEMSIGNKMDPSFVAKLKALAREDSTQALKLYSNSLQFHNVLQKDLLPNQSALGLDGIDSIKIPNDVIGFWPNVWWILKKALGLILTALAISLGAPFWFDILKKVMKVRSAGQVPEKAQQKGK